MSTHVRRRRIKSTKNWRHDRNKSVLRVTYGFRMILQFSIDVAAEDGGKSENMICMLSISMSIAFCDKCGICVKLKTLMVFVEIEA